MANVDNLIQGTGVLYVAAVGATEPDDGAVHNPPASGTWTDLGFTKDGVTMRVEQEYSELEVDQLVDVPGRRLTKREFVVVTNLAEVTLDNLKVALNGGTVTDGATSAASGVSATDTFEPEAHDGNNNPTYKALIFDGVAPSGLARRVIVRKALQVANVEFAYEKDGQTVYTVEFRAHHVSNAVKPFKVVDQTAAPTA